MDVIDRGAPLAPGKWLEPPVFWRSEYEVRKWRTMSLGKKSLLGIALALVLALVAMWTWHYRSRPQAPVEIAVFFSGTSHRGWANFVEAVRLVADPDTVEARDKECLVKLKPRAVLFRWYSEVGTGGMQRRVREVCLQRRPPLAVLGANNSSLTRALAEEMKSAKAGPNTPLLLMTTATQDELIQVHPNRTFRFGFNNSFQADTVVKRFRQYHDERHQATPVTINTVVVRVADNPYSTDFADRCLERLRQEFATPPFVNTDYSLPTETGGYEPSIEESQIARNISDQMRQARTNQWVLILPLGSSALRRLCKALDRELQLAGLRNTKDFMEGKSDVDLVVLTGDAVDYYDFGESEPGHLEPEQTPGAVVFFAHTNPTDETVASPPNRNVPSRGLNREVAIALLSIIPRLGQEPTADRLEAALREYQATNEPFFRDHERWQGGGAILAMPKKESRRGEDRTAEKLLFQLELPRDWLAVASQRTP